MLYECTLRRNCSMTPRQVARAYAVLCTISLAIALAFFLHGIWMVLAFSLVELSCVGLALLIYARHALDRERILLSSDCLLVECVQADKRSQARLDPLRTRVLSEAEAAAAAHAGRGYPRRALVMLESRGVRIEIGRFVNEAQRRQVARELRQVLRQIALH